MDLNRGNSCWEWRLGEFWPGKKKRQAQKVGGNFLCNPKKWFWEIQREKMYDRLFFVYFWMFLFRFYTVINGLLRFFLEGVV